MKASRKQNPYVFKASEIDALFEISEEKSVMKIKKGEVIFTLNTKPLGLYFVQSGKIKIFKTESDKEKELVIASKGDYFGLGSLMRNKKHTCTAVALVNSTLYFMPSKEFLKLSSNFPDISHLVLVKLCNLLDEA